MSGSEYDDAAEFYDSEHFGRVEDIPFYVEYARRQGSPVLELGCGTGRVLLPIAESGVEGWGLDASENILDIARTKIAALSKDVASRVVLGAGDMREFSLPKKFNLVIIPFNTFLLLRTKEDREKALRRIRGHLTDSGLLIIDIFAPRYDLLVQGSTARFMETTHIGSGLPLSVTTFSRYDHAKQLVHVTKLFDVRHSDGSVKRTVQKFTICYIFRYEMEHLLEKEGFQIVDVFGTFDKNPYDYKSGIMIFVAKKKD